MPDDILRTAAELSISWLDSIDEPPVFPTNPDNALRRGLDLPLTEEGVDPITVLKELAAGASPGLVKSPGGRYFGFVTGGALPVSVGADWLTSAWDQNAFSYVSSPAAAVIEEVAARWLLDLLHLPNHASTSFVTGCQMAHVTALAAARYRVLEQKAWDVSVDGLYGAPEVTVVCGAMRHTTVDRALRLLGMGTSSVLPVRADASGRMIPEALASTLDGLVGKPVIVIAQAGEVNTGVFDPLTRIAELARKAGAWLHIDAAFGMWAQAAPSLSHLSAGIELADSWAFDAHKWLNVPYDSGVAVVADTEAHLASMSYTGAYLIASSEQRDASDWTPESSRRARGIPIYAALRALGRQGVSDMIERSCEQAKVIASGLGHISLEVLNDVELNQVLFRAKDDIATEKLLTRIQSSGETWMSGTTWAGRKAIRLSVSGWATTSDDVQRTLAAIRAATQDASS
jgi:glutamate/tyrosine decarboxylase-like PLP-dependent enzyme